METTQTALDCGHVPNKLSESGTGFGRDPKTGNTYCYPCCKERERETMRTSSIFTGYLASDGRTITDWPGGILATVTRESESRNNFGARITHVRATGEGKNWYGKGGGRGMVITMRACKA